MKASEIRLVNLHEHIAEGDPGDDPGGTGGEDAFRNLMLREIAAQLAEIRDELRKMNERQEKK